MASKAQQLQYSTPAADVHVAIFFINATKSALNIPTPSESEDSSMPAPASKSNGFSPVLIAVICILAAIFLIVSYYALVARFVNSRRNRVRPDEHRRGAHDQPMDMTGDEGPIFWPEFRQRGLSKEEIESLPAVEYRSLSWSKSVAVAKMKMKEDARSLQAFVDKDRPPGTILDHGWHAGNKLGENEAKSEVYYCGSTDCAVCLSGFEEGEMVRVLPRCSHSFHFACIRGWLQSHPNCPLCRTDVLSADPKVSSSHGDAADDVSLNTPAEVEAPAAATDGVPQETAPMAISHRRQLLHIIDEAREDGQAIQLRPPKREQKLGAAGRTRNQSFHGISSLVLIDGMRKRELEPSLGFRCFSTGRVSMSHSQNSGNRDVNERHTISRSSSFIFRMGNSNSNSDADTQLHDQISERERQVSMETAVDIDRLLASSTLASSSSPCDVPSSYHPSRDIQARRQLDKSKSIDFSHVHTCRYYGEDDVKNVGGADERMPHSVKCVRAVKRSFSGSGRRFGFKLHRISSSNYSDATLDP